MAQVQITDVVVPAEFTAYQVENSMVSTALFQSGVALPNGEMQAQLQAAAQQFTVPFWSDIPDLEADITTDNSAVLATPQKITAASMLVRKSFLQAFVAFSGFYKVLRIAALSPLKAESSGSIPDGATKSPTLNAVR
ncbi:MAG: hypothetical protein WBD98_07005 [Acidobacteriaceae bacterium]